MVSKKFPKTKKFLDISHSCKKIKNINAIGDKFAMSIK